MKKLLGIVVLGLLCCNVGLAMCYSDCPSPPEFDSASVEKNIFEHGWKPLFSYKILSNLSSEDEKDYTKKELLEKIYMRLTDDYFILNSAKLNFWKIDPNSGYSGEWRLRCVAEYKIDCRITGPMF